MTVDQAYSILYTVVLICLAALIAVAIIRTFIGPRITDRILAVNMIGTIVITAFMILTTLLQESYLADVALIYAMVSFVAVLIFSAVYIRKNKEDR
ncbi:MAG: sodium:proton antiporter [Eubacterium sp.]|nr:sodium:proton antiporter [Eubacterium sp.]